MSKPEKPRRGRGRPKAKTDILLEYEQDPLTPEPFRRLASAARQRGITWQMLRELGNLDPSGLRRAFEAQRADPVTVKRVAKALGYELKVQRALCGEISFRAALGEARVLLFAADNAIGESASDRMSNPIADIVINDLHELNQHEVVLIGTRMVLANAGLDELFRPHRFRTPLLDVAVELFPKLRAEGLEEQFEDLEDHMATLEYLFKRVGVTPADQIRILDILRPYSKTSPTDSEYLQRALDEALQSEDPDQINKLTNELYQALNSAKQPVTMVWPETDTGTKAVPASYRADDALAKRSKNK